MEVRGEELRMGAEIMRLLMRRWDGRLGRVWMSMPETEKMDSWDATRLSCGVEKSSKGEVGESGRSVSRVGIDFFGRGESSVSSGMVEWQGDVRSRWLSTELRFDDDDGLALDIGVPGHWSLPSSFADVFARSIWFARCED